jgi:N-acetylglutamate synthase-like GNAT family acetyltransferase
MNILIEEARKEDLPFILELYAEKDIDNGKVLSIHDAGAIFMKMKTYPNYKIYLAKCDNQVIGTFALAIMDNLAHLGKSSGLVEDVVVATNMRSKGIGNKMMEHAMNICKKIIVTKCACPAVWLGNALIVFMKNLVLNNMDIVS